MFVATGLVRSARAALLALALLPLTILPAPPAWADVPFPNDCTEFSDFSDELTISNLQVTSQVAAPDGYVDLEIMADITNEDVGDFTQILGIPELADAGLDVAVDPPVMPIVFRDVPPSGNGSSQTPLRVRIKSGDVAPLVAGLASGDIHLTMRVKERPQFVDGVTVQYWSAGDRVRILTSSPTPLTFRDLVGDGTSPPPMIEGFIAAGGKFYTGADPYFLPDFLPKEFWQIRLEGYATSLGPPYQYTILPANLDLEGEDNPIVLMEAGSYCSGPTHYYDPVTHRNVPLYVDGVGPPDNLNEPEDHIQPVHFNGISFADGAVTVSGQMAVHAALPRTEIRIRPSRIKITTHLDVDVSMAAELEATRRIELSPEEKTVASLCFELPPLPAGPVSIPAALQLKHDVGASASFTGAAVVGFEKQVSAGMTIVYDSSLPPGQQFTTHQQSTPSPIEFSPPRFTRDAAAHARVSTALTTTLMIGPTAAFCTGGGAYFRATGYGTFDAQLGDTPSWSLGHGEEITVGASLSFFGLDIASFEAPVVDFPGGQTRTETTAAEGGPFSGDDVRWAVSIDDLDSANNIETTTVRATSDGGAAIVSYGPINSANYLTRLDPFGSYLWHKKFKLGRTPSRLVVLPDDSMIVAGAINHTTDQWLAKLDPDGNVLWARDAAIGDPDNATILGNCALKDIEPIRSGNDVTGFIVAGDIIGNPITTGDGCLVRLDADGAVLWGKIYRQEGKQRFNAVTPTADGGFAVAGYTEVGAGSILYEDNGLLARTDADGNLLWSKAVVEDKQRIGELFAIVQSADGTLYFTGRASGPVFFPGALLVGRIGSDGGNPQLHLVWGAREIPGDSLSETTESFFDIGMDMTLTPGGIAVVGTQGIQVDPTPDLGPDIVRAWAFEMDADLGVEWLTMFDGPWSDEFHSVARTENGLLVAGVSQSFLPLGTGFEEESLTVMHLPFEGMLRFLDGTGATSTYLGPIGRPVQSQFGNSVDSPMTVIDAVLRSTTPITGLVVTPPRFCVTALTAAGHDSPLDACDQDSDGDGIEGLRDNCPDDLNADQADIDGDGDGDVCDPPLCGNAVIEAGEACDDGNLLDGDGCESTCTVTALCEQLVSLTKGKIVVKKLGAPVGDELLEFSGTLAIPLGEALDPVLTGLQLLVDDPTGAAPVLDLTERTNPVPPGAMAPSTCDPNPVVGKKKKDGWMLNKSGTTFTYHNRTGALPAAGCAAGSARGLRKIIVKDLRAGKGVVTFKVVAGPAVFGPPNGPLAGSILFGAGSSTGPCGQVDFVAEACASNNNGTMLTCR